MPADGRAPRWAWPACAVLAALLAIPGVFTLSRVFFVRDLASTYLPHHLWFRSTVLSGQLPFWDPYLGCGYSTLDDPVFQTFFAPALVLRLLPATLGFNLFVALPFAVAALGAYVFLRRHAAPQAAALGSILCCASGPVVSTASSPNLSWSCACLPWILAGVDAVAARTTPRRVAALSAGFGLMLLAGEPVTFAAAVALAVAYAGCAAPVPPSGWRARAAAAGATIAAVALGVALASIQVLPAAEAAPRSIRAAGMLRDMWSLHPARWVEFVSPFFFGKYVGMPHELTQWLFALNDRREPLLISLYIGVPALSIALLGAAVSRKSRFTVFWCAVCGASLLAALGAHTPVYRAAQGALPALKLLRYPSKLVEPATLAVAVLAALGWNALLTGPRISRRALGAAAGPAVVLAAGAVVVLVGTSFFQDAALGLSQRLATVLDLPDPAAAAHSLVGAARSSMPRLIALSAAAAAGLALAASSRREAPLARHALFALVAADLVVTGAPVNPTIDASALAPPAWIDLTRPHPDDRVFVARNFLDDERSIDDAPPRMTYPPDTRPVAYLAAYEAALGANLSPAAIRMTLSREMTGLRPREYFDLLERFSRGDRAARYRFLSWAGTRYYVVATPPPNAAAAIAALPALGPIALYESEPTGGRVFVATHAIVEPSAGAQIDRLFDPGFPLAATVSIDREPPLPAGTTLPAGAPSATIVDETATSVLVTATAPEDGAYLVLLDSFDPGWNAAVDGRSAPLLRADGVFRAVRIPAGRHQVRFAFRPRAAWTGGLISLATLAGLVIAVVRRPW
jgi:hypothetical protein